MSDDERVELALAALAEVVDPAAVGPLVDASIPAPGVIDLRFATTQPGYPGWFWTVSTSALPDVEPTVLELQLLPGEGALVAPPWVAWEERLAEWRRAHPAGAAEDEDDLDDDEDEDDDDVLDGDEVLDDDVDLDGADVDGIAAEHAEDDDEADDAEQSESVVDRAEPEPESEPEPEPEPESEPAGRRRRRRR